MLFSALTIENMAGFGDYYIFSVAVVFCIGLWQGQHSVPLIECRFFVILKHIAVRGESEFAEIQMSVHFVKGYYAISLPQVI